MTNDISRHSVIVKRHFFGAPPPGSEGFRSASRRTLFGRDWTVPQKLRLCALDLQFEVLRVELRDHIARADTVADVDQAGRDLAGDAKSHISLVARPHHANKFAARLGGAKFDAQSGPGAPPRPNCRMPPAPANGNARNHVASSRESLPRHRQVGWRQGDQARLPRSSATPPCTGDVTAALVED